MSNLIDAFFSDRCDDKKEDECDMIIGIDLGTSNSCCGIWRNGQFENIPDEYGNRTIPSIVVHTNGNMYVGHDTRQKILDDKHNVFYEMKRLMGKKYDDNTIVSDKKFLTYDICENQDGYVRVIKYDNDKKILMSPEELSAYVLIKLKNMATTYLKQQIKKVVIAVPAYFNDTQRQATRNAAVIAGLECVRIIGEPIASALAFGLNKMSKNSHDPSAELNVVVYDLGGGTLDVSLMTINNGVFEVIGSSGNTHIGGVDFDNRLCDYCINTFKKMNNDFTESKMSLDVHQKLKYACESAKKVLSTSTQTMICITNFYDSKNLIVNITREKFNELCHDLMTLCLKPLDDVLVGCDIKKHDIHEIILVGGMTRVPSIRENVYKYFNKCPNSSVNPDEIVAMGSAIQGYLLSHKSDPFSESVTLLDTTPLSMGVETLGGIMSVMIPRSSLIPVSEKKMFTNDTPDETSVTIRIFEGERKMTKDNFYVGEFELSDLQPKPIGYHKIEITFSIDVNGMIIVTANDTQKNISNEIRINCKCGHLSGDEITKIVASAKQYEETDKLDKRKMKMHHELLELCDNILKNVETTNMQHDDKELIVDDVNKMLTLLQQKYGDIDMVVYENELRRLKKNYCVLIIKQSDDEHKESSLEKCDGYVETSQGTSVFQNEDDELKNQSKIISDTTDPLNTNDETCTDEKSSEQLNEIRKIRDTLLDNCYKIMDITRSTMIDIDEETRSNLKNYAEDLTVWVHVQQNLSLENCSKKMNELEEYCNKCIGDKSQQQTNAKDELYALCKSLKSSIETDLLALQEYDMIILNGLIRDTIEWLDNNVDIDESECIEKINQINERCNRIYEKYTEKNENNDT